MFLFVLARCPLCNQIGRQDFIFLPYTFRSAKLESMILTPPLFLG